MPLDASLSFAVSRDRDAWAVIRGFVLQVDRTVEAWLDLAEGERLELERGEDIDRIARALGGGSVERVRLLEQVKHRQAAITLQSPPCRAALAHFHEHRRANPTLPLRFRFTTTASVGRERGNRLPGRLPGIVAWEKVRRGELTRTQTRALLSALGDLVSELARPEGVPREQWLAFQRFAAQADADEWRQFVSAFEWSTQAPNSASLRPRIRKRLRAQFGLANEEAADLAYQRLFAEVFDRLSTPGLKLLTREQLIDQLSCVPSVAERERIAQLEVLHNALAAKVDELQEQMQGMNDVLAATTASVRQLTDSMGIRAAIDPYSIATPPTAPPPKAVRASARIHTVASLVPDSKRPQVYALHGGAASGKTQLALLVAQRLGDNPAWIRLAGLNAEEAAKRLTHAIHAILAAANDVRRDLPDWTQRAAGLAEAADIVVLDDVPQFREGDELGSRLLPVLTSCLARGHSVVLTSAVPLVTLERLLPADVLVASTVPPLTAEETREVLAAYGAPPAVLATNAAELLVGISDGHPLLVHAVGQYLQARAWLLNLDALNELFRHRYAEPVNRETAQALLDRIADQPSRELLYRLSLVGLEFSQDDVEALAAVEPSIGTRRERFSALLGPWIQPTDVDRYQLSPLVRVLGHGDLAPDVRRECHAVLADRIVQRKRIGELEFSHALTHFVSAERYDAAGWLLVQALHAVHVAPPTNVTIITAVWCEAPIPAAISPSLRAMIRAYQAVIAHRDGRDPAPFLADLTTTLGATADLPAWAEFTPSVLVAISMGLEDPVATAPFMQRALTRWPEVRDTVRNAIRETGGRELPDLEVLVWVCARGIVNDDGLEAWIGAVAGLPSEVREKAFGTVLGHAGAASVANGVLLLEYHLPAEQRDWWRAARRLERLESTARGMGLP